MFKPQQHIIRRFLLDIKISGEPREAFVQQNEVKKNCLEAVNESLDGIFNQLNADGQIIQIHTMEIDLGEVTPQNIKQKLSSLVWNKLKDLIESAELNPNMINSIEPTSKNQPITQDKPEHHSLALLLHFLAYGTFPWWAKKTKWEDWQKELLSILKKPIATDFRVKIKSLLQQSVQARDRLIYQFSNSFIQQFIHYLREDLPANKLLIKRANTTIDSPASLKMQLDNYLSIASIPSTARDNTFHEETNVVLSPAIMDKIINPEQQEVLLQQPQEIAAQAQKTTSRAKSEASPQSWEMKRQAQYTIQAIEKEVAYFIDNGGIAIILPCISPLLEQLNLLTEEKYFRSSHTHIKAIQLIQFLATGEAETPEHLLVLNKIVCGWPLSDAIPQKSLLTVKEKVAANAFLQAMIDHWGALKKTSPDGLRHNFLNRNGKLSYINGHWLLQVEQASYDSFLLKKLPWVMSIIKFKWMQERIHVEWM